MLSALVRADAYSDDLPALQIARGKSERALGGIDLLSSTVAQAETRLGVPDESKEISPETKGIAGERLYVWRKSGMTLKLQTTFLHNRGSDAESESTELIGIEGTDGTLGRTGRGLKLGDRITYAERLYGRRYKKRVKLVEFEWKSGTQLHIHFDDSGAIVKMELFAPE